MSGASAASEPDGVGAAAAGALAEADGAAEPLGVADGVAAAEPVADGVAEAPVDAGALAEADADADGSVAPVSPVWPSTMRKRSSAVWPICLSRSSLLPGRETTMLLLPS